MKSSISSRTLPDITERNALRVLNAVAGFGSRRITILTEHFGSASLALAAPALELAMVAGIPQAAALNLKHFPCQDFLEKDDKAVVDNGARVVTCLDEEYPPQLRTIVDAPVVLYVTGQLPGPADACVAIVGARNATLYGMDIAERFAMSLAERGVVIISGLAKGIDAAAHKGALQAGGRTVGVLGCGLDIVYPSDNAGLFAKMRELDSRCAIMSEFPFSTLPAPFNFPRRNRIVSGLSLGVVVVEANAKSGALITAAFAAEQGREVFAVPGRVDSRLSAGPHALIKQGAKVTLCIEDILEELPVSGAATAVSGDCAADPSDLQGELDADEQLIWSLVSDGQLSIEELEQRTGRPPALLTGPLLSLQIKRLVRELPGKVYERSPRV